jgi:hypothetical protein
VKLPIAASLILLLCSCATARPAEKPVHDLTALKSDPAATLKQYEGQRIRVAGYFFDPHFLPHCDAPFHQSGDDIRDTYVDLPYSNENTFRASIDQRIIVEATVRKPKRFRYGGGDLYFQVEKSEQDFYLDDAKLISIDTSVPHCSR